MSFLKEFWLNIKAALVYDEYADVKAVYKKFSMTTSERPVHLTKRKLHERLASMRSELDEFETAIATQDLEGLADALVDVVFFAKGTAAMMGLPWEELWVDVVRANSSKEPGPGQHGKVDMVKPPGWVPPMTMAILREVGYRRVQWSFPASFVVDERKCYDDQP